MTTEAETLINRTYAINENIDPFGKKWGIAPIKGSSLYKIVQIKEGEATIPKAYPTVDKSPNLNGKYTHPTRAQKDISQYVKMAWDWNDRQVKLKDTGDKRFAENKETKPKAKARAKVEELGDVVDNAADNG